MNTTQQISSSHFLLLLSLSLISLSASCSSLKSKIPKITNLLRSFTRPFATLRLIAPSSTPLACGGNVVFIVSFLKTWSASRISKATQHCQPTRVSLCQVFSQHLVGTGWRSQKELGDVSWLKTSPKDSPSSQTTSPHLLQHSRPTSASPSPKPPHRLSDSWRWILKKNPDPTWGKTKDLPKYQEMLAQLRGISERCFVITDALAANFIIDLLDDPKQIVSSPEAK